MVDHAPPPTAATIQPESDTGAAPITRVPCLTILCHPDMRRVGERAPLGSLFDGRVTRLTREAPAFVAPRGGSPAPLRSRFVSTSKPLDLAGGPIGVELRPHPGARVDVDGAPLSAARTVGLAQLRAGAIITLARRVALLLHTVQDAGERPPACGMIGESDALDALRRRIVNVADLGVNVLIRGESGAGKELVATAIWRASKRADAPFEACNMSGVPDGNLGLSALFGHVKGAFTGATGRFRGLLERNHDGTVFLDEIGACDGQVQDRLLRVLQDGVVAPVGTERGFPVDVRVLSATDADLEALVASGRFRGPLLHRLSQYVIDVPPLSARPGDIARLAVHFLREALAEIGEPHRLDPPVDDAARPWFPAELMVRLVRHDWSGGNVRALANAIRRLVIDNRGRDAIDVGAARLDATPRAAGADGPGVTAPAPADHPGGATAGSPNDADPADATASRATQPRDVSRDEFLAAFRKNNYSPAKTAKTLGRPKATIYSWMQQFGVRLVKQIPPEELVASYEAHGRDLAATARGLEVSPRSLQIQLRALGVEVIPE